VPPVHPRVNPVWLTEVADRIGVEGLRITLMEVEEIEPPVFTAVTMTA